MPKKSFYLNGAAIAEITELEGQLSASQSEVTRLTSELETATAERDEAVATLDKIEPDKVALQTNLTKATADLATATASLTAANEKLATFDADVEKAAQAKFASLGGDPIPAGGKGDDDKSDFSGLTGLARATAAHKASKN